jgi:hypothetical protein
MGWESYGYDCGRNYGKPYTKPPLLIFFDVTTIISFILLVTIRLWGG